jgi:hypothetical protein
MTYLEAQKEAVRRYGKVPIDDYNCPIVWKCIDGMHYIGFVGYGRPQNDEAIGRGDSWESAFADADCRTKKNNMEGN